MVLRSEMSSTFCLFLHFIRLEELANDQYYLEFTSLNFCLEVNSACVTEKTEILLHFLFNNAITFKE